MSTGSTIALVTQMGAKLIYLAQDNPEETFDLLNRHYATEAQVNTLFQLGHLKVLGTTPEACVPVSSRPSTVRSAVTDIPAKSLRGCEMIYAYVAPGADLPGVLNQHNVSQAYTLEAAGDPWRQYVNDYEVYDHVAKAA